MIGEGWSVGCQADINSDQLQSADSLRQARLSLEEAISHPVRSLAFGDATSWKTCESIAEEAGFECLFTLRDDLNHVNEATEVIKRSPLYHRGPRPRQPANDPYRLLALGRDRGGWIVDVVRLVDRYPSDPTQDCTPKELEARFKAVRRIGAGMVWIAPPEVISSYRALRLSTQIQNYVAGSRRINYTLALTASARSPIEGKLTFVARLGSAWKSPKAVTDEETVYLQPSSKPGVWLFTHRVTDGLEVTITDGSGKMA